MTAEITLHPACRPALALSCVDAIEASAEDVRADASMLYVIAKWPRQPLLPVWVSHVARTAQAMAGDIAHTVGLWRCLPVDPLPAAHRDAVARHVANIRRHAHHVAAIGDAADACPPHRGYLAGVLAALLAAAEALRQTAEAAWIACRAQPDPAA